MPHEPPIESFLREIILAIKQGGEPKSLLDATSDQMRRLFSGPFFLGDEYMTPTKGSINARPLHIDKEVGLAVVVCAWASGQATPIHDHGAWGVIGALRNRTLLTCYRRDDDLTTPGFADVGEVSKTLISENSFGYVRPPDELITKIENPYPDPAVTLHVFGEAVPWQFTFDPPAKTATALEPNEATIGI